MGGAGALAGPAEPVRTEIVHKSDDAAPVPACWGRPMSSAVTSRGRWITGERVADPGSGTVGAQEGTVWLSTTMTSPTSQATRVRVPPTAAPAPADTTAARTAARAVAVRVPPTAAPAPADTTAARTAARAVAVRVPPTAAPAPADTT